MLLNNDYLISEIFKKDEKNYNLFKEDYENNFIKFKAKERFTIPIIGKISSGKSTFLNSIISGNYLSCSTDIDTKFVCILRHNKNCKSPKFFNCELKQEKIDYKYRDFEFFYFEKTEELKGDVLENIKEINQSLKNYEIEVNLNERDINKYFYIL
jgi:septin family protein